MGGRHLQRAYVFEAAISPTLLLAFFMLTPHRPWPVVSVTLVLLSFLRAKNVALTYWRETRSVPLRGALLVVWYTLLVAALLTPVLSGPDWRHFVLVYIMLWLTFLDSPAFMQWVEVVVRHRDAEARRKEQDVVLNKGRFRVEAWSSLEPCVICLDDFCNGDQALKLECGHVYHAECIRTWFTRGSPTCAMRCTLPGLEPPADAEPEGLESVGRMENSRERRPDERRPDEALAPPVGAAAPPAPGPEPSTLGLAAG